MSKKIIVAGAGHGGLAAAALLAKRGLEVTVYERGSEGALGHDWTDNFAPGSLRAAELPLPPEDKFAYKENMTFYSPDMKTPLRQSISESELEIKMERRDICALLIENALACGVKIVYDCEIECPLLNGDRVTGIKTSLGNFYADLVIDSAGINSPVRTLLPHICGVDNNPGPYERFYVYRAFYDRADNGEPEDLYKVCLLPEGKTGIAWIATEPEYTDLLIGRFAPFDTEEAERTAGYFRQIVPQLGTKVLRGGSFTQIPVRHPLPLMVCDGYAAIGDSAFMTMPIIGSGIANSFKAAAMLANAVLRDYGGAYSAETLWPYQLEYYKRLGSGFAVLSCVRGLLTKISPEDLDFIFEKGILTAKEFAIGADTTSIGDLFSLSPAEMLERAKSAYPNKELIKKLLPAIAQIGRVAALTAAIPRAYDKKLVSLWAEKYRNSF